MFKWLKKRKRPRRPQIDRLSDCFTSTDPKDPSAAVLHVVKCEKAYRKSEAIGTAHFEISPPKASQTRVYARRSGFPPEMFLAMVVDGEMQLHVERLNAKGLV